MAKNEIPYYTKDSRYAAVGAPAQNVWTNMISSGANGSKLMHVGLKATYAIGASGTVDFRVELGLWDGTTVHSITEKHFVLSNSAPLSTPSNTTAYTTGINLLKEFGLPLDKNGNPNLNLPAGTSLRFQYSQSTSGTGSVTFSSIFAHLEDY